MTCMTYRIDGLGGSRLRILLYASLLRTNEVPPLTIPVSGSLERFTFQDFGDPDPTLVAKPNQDARPPNDLTHWPPSVITNFILC